MAHELTTHADGRVEFAYRTTDGAPWHGLGQQMADNATIDQWRQAAGMDWKIQRGVVRYNIDREGTQLAMPEQHVLFRNDTKAPLGVVSEKYNVVQPAEVLEFFRELAHVGGLEMSAAGTIYGGKRFWATAKIGDAAPLGLQDKVGGYLLISTSADGSLSTEVRRTTVRVVCRNTLQMARGEKAAFKITHRSKFDADQVKEFMGLNETAWTQFKRDMVKLANTTVTNDTAERVLKELFKSPETSGYKKVMDLFNGAGIGSDLDGSVGTAWGLINSVTEYADRHVRATSEANRFVSSQWGPGAQLKAQALNLLLPA